MPSNLWPVLHGRNFNFNSTVMILLKGRFTVVLSLDIYRPISFKIGVMVGTTELYSSDIQSVTVVLESRFL